MTHFIKTQNAFSAGEVSPDFFACSNINGLSKLENMDVTPGGGLSRRKGLEQIDSIGNNGRLIPFSVDENNNYLLVLTNLRLRIYNGITMVADMVAPWASADLCKIQYAQRSGTMMFVHPLYRPQMLQKVGNSFSLSQYGFSSDENGFINMPRTRFADSEDVKITVSSSTQGNTYATFTTNRDFWQPANIATYIFLMGKQWIITHYISPTQVTAFLGETFIPPVDPITDWTEAVFSERRGWPASISFYQDRLVFGGSPSLPSTVWMSHVGQHTNFSAGTGLDDEAIALTLLSQERQQICTIVSSDNLQILTSVGEWAISSKPLTPSNVDIKQHTSVGSVWARNLPPQQIEGRTVFVSANEHDIRELNLDDLTQNYNATDLCAYSKHLLGGVIDIAYNSDTHQLFVVLNNGTISVLNYNSSLEIAAWAKYTTAGQFMSVAVVNNETYVIVKRDSEYTIEKFSSDTLADCNEYEFAYNACSLPLVASGHNADKLHIHKISARIMNTKSISINAQRITLPNWVYTDDTPGFTGDVSINQLGTSCDYMVPIWRIHGTESLPITVLSVTTYGRYTI
ncbi:MAG: hypothetical protein KBS86_03250 [Proteobacteria bacterium]|nr:hypothetical protein [Candidatus Enterousia scatequi]